MSAAHLTLPPPKDFNAAQQQYVEQFGSVLVMNTYLKIALLVLSLVCLGLIVLNFKTFRALRDLKPLVIRINEVGRAEASATRASPTNPGGRDQIFLERFCPASLQPHEGQRAG